MGMRNDVHRRTLKEMGTPIPQGRTLACVFCWSDKLVFATCEGTKGPEHLHVRCGECRAVGPPVQPGDKGAAIAAWELRTPNVALAKKLTAPEAVRFFNGKVCRDGRRAKDLEPCPFCGYARIIFVETGVISYHAFMGCVRCGTEGPWATYRKDARDLWNQAHTENKKWVSGFAKDLVEA